MSEEAIPTTPHDDLSSSSVTTETSSKGYLLAQQLCNLQQENLVVGKQNQELALQFHDASNYNQALGFDLYQLDQEIGELEERLSNMKNQIKEIDQQTKAITKKADEYKNALRNDKEFSSLAKHLRNLQKTHHSASKSLAQLREILGDPKFSMLDGALQLMQEKIHFLYWSNTELHQQIELMQQLLNEGREGAIIEEDLEKMNDLSNLKLEYYDMKLFESQLKNGGKNALKIIQNESDSSAPADSTKYVLSPSKNKKSTLQKKNDEPKIKSKNKLKEKPNLYEDVLVPDENEEGKYKIFRRPLKSDGKRKKYQWNNTRTKKMRQTRVQNQNGDEYEYLYEYDYSDTNENDNDIKKRKKTRVDPEDEEIDKIKINKDNLNEFKKNPKTGKKTRIHKNKSNEDEIEPEEEKEEKEEKIKTKRRKRNNNKKKKSHVDNDNDSSEDEIEPEEEKEKNIKTKRRKRNNNKKEKSPVDNDNDSSEDEKEDNEYGYEYEYEPEPTKDVKKTSSKINNIINSKPKTKKEKKEDQSINNNNDSDIIIEEEEEDISEFCDSEGFSHRRNKKTGEMERYRRFEFSDGKEYEDVIVSESEQSRTNIKMKRNRIDKKNNCYKHYKKKNSKSDKISIIRQERVLYNNDEEYEYEYEYDDNNNTDDINNRKRNRQRVPTKSEIIPTFNNEDENGFRIQTTLNSRKEKVKKIIRTFKDVKGQTYKDTIEKNEYTGEDEVVRRMTKSDKTDELKYSSKKKKMTRHSRTHNLKSGKEIEYEYEYDTDQNGEKILLSKNIVDDQEDEIIPAIILKSEVQNNRRNRQGFDLPGRKRKVEMKNGIVYEDTLQSDPEEGSQKVIRTIMKGEKIQYTPKGKNKVRRVRVQNDDKEEYEYEYEYDDHNEKKKTRVPKKDEQLDEIGDGPTLPYKKRTDKETGETVLVQKVASKDGGNLYEDVVTTNDQGEVIVTRRLLSKGNDDDEKAQKLQYDEKTVTDEKGHKKKLRTRRSKVRYEDGHEEEFEYEYDDVENTKTRKFVPKEEEAVESITSAPKISRKEKKMLNEGKSDSKTALSNFGYKDVIDERTGRRKKVRIAEDENGQKYEYTKEEDPQTKVTRITKRKLDNSQSEPKLKYDKNPLKKSKTRRSEARLLDSEREYEYEYEYNENDSDDLQRTSRKKLPKKDADGFYQNNNKRTVHADDGNVYEDTKTKDGKIIRRQLDSGKSKKRHTRVRNENDEEYEYEYDDEKGFKEIVKNIDDEVIPHIKLESRPRVHKVGENFAYYKGREVRRVQGSDGHEYQDEKIGNEIKRSRIDHNGQIKYKKKRGKNKEKIKERHVLYLRPDDEEVEYEYQYEYENDDDDEPTKTRKVTDDREIESLLKRKEFKEKTDPKSKKTRLVRKVKAENGDLYEDEIDEKKKRIIRRKLDKNENGGYSYQKVGNNKRMRHSRIGKLSPLLNDDEYEYEYEYDDDNDEVIRRKAKNLLFEPIEKLNAKRYVSDSSQICEEEEDDDETGKKKNIRISKHQNVEKLINPATGKPLTVRKNGKDYEIVFNPKTNKTVRQRKVRCNNNDDIVFEYDDDDLDEDGNPKKTTKRIINDDHAELDSEGFYENKKANGIKTRRVTGKDGSFYIDTIENGGRIRRRVVNSASSSDLIYKKMSNNKLVRHSRVHDECGEEKEYEYEYENEEDEEFTRKVIKDKSKHEIEVIKENDFKEVSDSKSGEKIKSRKKKGSKGELYEDTLQDNKIIRRPLDKKGKKLKYDVDENGVKTRRSRVRNENNEEYEYEYEYDEENENPTRTRIHPNDEKIERLDGAKKYEGGFVDQYETVNGEITDNKRKVRKVKGDSNQTFEDELVDGKIKRRPLNRKGKISYKRRNDKTVRQERVRNAQGDEYEYEYEYDDNENRKKYRVDPNDEKIEPIENSDDEYEYEEDENESNLEGFSSQKNEKTGEIEKSRKFTNSQGHIYKDTIKKNEDTGEDEVHRRIIKSESTDELEYSAKPGKNRENKIVRHSRTQNLVTGDETEYEYEYETDKSGDKVSKGKKKKIENPKEEIIQAISIVHSPKRSHNSEKKDKRKTKKKDKDYDTDKNQSEVPLISENGLTGFHLPVSLFQSEDQSKPKPKLQPSNPAIMQQPKPTIVDLSEYESKVNPDKKNPLTMLIPKLRAESGALDNDDINSPENLQKILEALQQQIAERTEVRDSLKERIKELEHPQYVKRNTATAKKAQKFKMSGIKRVNVESPPDPIKILALNNYDLRHVGSQTELTGETITYHQNVLDKQRKEKLAAEELRTSLESLKEKIRATESKIEKAKEDGQIKEERISTLKTEIANVKDELLKEDKNTLREEEKAREYAQQLSEIDEQIRVKQQQLEKINSQVGALHLHLKEMQKFRVILESELANLVNREKPEIRQLIEDVNSYRIQIDVSSANVESMTKKVEGKRQQLEELLCSDEMNQYTELKLKKINLERRIKKWSSLMKDSRETLQSIETFSAKNANVRKNAIEQYKNKVRSFMKQEMELDDLEKYQELVESMIREHKQNWM